MAIVATGREFHHLLLQLGQPLARVLVIEREAAAQQDLWHAAK